MLESDSAVPDRDMLVRLLQVGVVIEEYAEEKSAYMLSAAVDDEFAEDVLMDSRDESREHRETLLELISEIDGSGFEADAVEAVVREAVEASVPRPGDRREALETQLRSERLAYDYYDRLIEALRASDLEREVVGRVVETLEEIREDELEDARELEEILNQEALDD